MRQFSCPLVSLPSAFFRLASFAVALAGPGPFAPALAQRVDDNAATSAGDAFGQAIGNERVGLYTVDDVRGFNPVDAGNTRIEGLYFAPVDRPPNRLIRGSKVRVGISAQGYPFPAPTGIVDYEPSVSAQADQLTLSLERAQFGSRVLNLDVLKPLAEDLKVYVGGTMRRQNRHEGAISNRTSFLPVFRGNPGPAPGLPHSTGGPGRTTTRQRPRSSPAATISRRRSGAAR